MHFSRKFSIIHDSEVGIFLLGDEPLQMAPQLPLLKIARSFENSFSGSTQAIDISWDGAFPPKAVQLTGLSREALRANVLGAWRLPFRFREGQQLDAELNDNGDGTWHISSADALVEIDVLAPPSHNQLRPQALRCTVIVEEPPITVRISGSGMKEIVATLPPIIPT